MSRNQGYRRNVARIIFLLIFIFALIVGGFIWLDFLGLIDFKQQLAPILSLIGVEPQAELEEPFSATLLDDERLAKERQALAIERRELEQVIAEFEQQRLDFQQKENEIAEREKSIVEKQNSLSEAIRQYDNKVANLEQNARYVMGMPPDDAVAIMNEYDIKDLVDLLRTSERLSRESGENSLVPFWISLMPDRKRAADIQRLMVEKPGLTLDE